MPIGIREIEYFIEKNAPNRDTSKDGEKLDNLLEEIRKICYNGFLTPEKQFNKIQELIESKDYNKYLNLASEKEQKKFCTEIVEENNKTLSVEEKSANIDKLSDYQKLQKKLELNAKLKTQNAKYLQGAGKDLKGIFVKDKNSNDLPGMVDLAKKLYSNINPLHPIRSAGIRTVGLVLGTTGITAFKLSRLVVRSGAWLAKKGITRLGAVVGTAKRANQNRKAKEAAKDMAILKDVSERLVSDLEKDFPNKQIDKDMLSKLSPEDRQIITDMRECKLDNIEGIAEELQERSDDELDEMKQSFVDAKATTILNKLPKKNPPYTLEDVNTALSSIEEVKTVGKDGKEKTMYTLPENSKISIDELNKAGCNATFFKEYKNISSMSKKDAGKLYQHINVGDDGKLDVRFSDTNKLDVNQELIKNVSGLRFSNKGQVEANAANKKIVNLRETHKQTEAMRIETNATVDIMLAKNLRTYVKELDYYIDRYETQRLTDIPTEINKQELANLKNLRKIAAQKVQMLENKGIIEVANEGKNKNSKLTDKAKELLLNKDNMQEFTEHGKKQMREAETYRKYDENSHTNTDGSSR